MNKFKVGDHVKVKSRNELRRWITSNEMMLNRADTIVTIRIVEDDDEFHYCYFIEEDIEEYHGNDHPGWTWAECFFDYIVEDIKIDKDALSILLA